MCVTFKWTWYKAGCGGIDLYGGAFSFANSEQYTQLLRSIGANAAGYAFQLALQTAMPDIASVIETIQRKILALNQHFGNSCQLAQGLVNDTLGAMNMKRIVEGETDATATGMVRDFFKAWSASDGKSGTEMSQENGSETYNATIGNIVWMQLKKNSAASWFRYGDDDLLETILSMTGSIVVTDLKEAEDGKGKVNNVITQPGGLVTLEDLLKGGTFEVYSCASDQKKCMSNPGARRTVTLDSLVERLQDVLVGSDSSVGLITKWSLNTSSVTDEEQAFLANMPSTFGSLTKRAAVSSPEFAIGLSDEVAKSMALQMVMNVVRDLFQVADVAMSNSDVPETKEALEELRGSRRKVYEEYQSPSGIQIISCCSVSIDAKAC
ncbi:conjugal transfer protein TraH [Roseibium sp. RKSG952]|uniref:conjugal transfer protein TraH n=1 Tax=Roseibium sp. RKSG952 TaxID=2529384 RepID=UPI0013C7F5C1|nr:conjugal transfer protein TraH [Roseibium sp. RKSG952]